MTSEEPSLPISPRPESEVVQQASSRRSYIGEIVRLDQTDSTNQVAAERARAGAPDGLVVVADAQSAGRGRQSRRWASPPSGAFLCSVLFRPDLPIDQVHHLTAIVGLAARGTCARFRASGVSLKWPNDLVAGTGKLAGVLAELVIAVPPAVVVGIGCNLFWPVDWPPSDDATGLAELISDAITLEQLSGERVDRDEFLEVFLDLLDELYAVLRGPDGPSKVIAQYRLACSTIGTTVRVDTPTGEFVGVARDVNDDGSLELEVDGQLRNLTVADVVHLRAAGSSA
jgi:BirA family transcriptional regulator, biotin operon repressor / biotin---[acetyl-CoA-carboxylase] ligase